MKSSLLIIAIILAACQNRSVEPVALVPDDMCTYCKMAISEKPYASELIDSEGDVFKFDDVGCMLNFLNRRMSGKSARAYFVMDFNERQWIKAEEAFYVRSSSIKTPMSGGIIAFKTQAQAAEAAGKFQGQLLRFNELLGS